MNKYFIISGLLLVFLFSCNVSAGYVNGHNCTSNIECDSANCNMGYCCNTGQCGSYYGCRDEGSIPFGGPNTVKCSNGSWVTEPSKKANGLSCSNGSECVSDNCNAGYCCNSGQCGSYYGCLGEGQCVPTSYCDSGCFNGTFKKYFGASCGSTSDCSSGTCINGFCCNSGQCGYSTSRTGNCYDIGDEHYIHKCISEGTWRILDGNHCANNDDCVSNNCLYNTCRAATTTTTTTTSTTTTTMQCEDLWWFDDNTHFCGHKEFCGGYMYYGLRTFQSLSDCVEELNDNYCVGEGSNIIIVPGAAGCCAQLTPINPRTVNSSGECNPPSTGASICTICGNGVCGLGENKCNCPADCSATTTTSTTTSPTTTIMPCNNLWWFDSSTRVCGLKQFCGAYMYPSLRTFQNQADCLEELTGSNCIGEGNNILIYPGAAQCCAGLEPINPQDMGEFGACNPPSVGASVCAICGNGVCGPGENKCNCPVDCPCFEGISIDASWHGSEDDAPVMQLWIDNKLRAEWDTVNMDRYYDYQTNLSCGTHEISVAYNIPAQAQKTLSIYKIMAECTKLNAGDINTQSTGALDYTYTKTNCGAQDECATPGDTPVCGEITLGEVVDYIGQWRDGEASLRDVVNLINMWLNQG